MITMTIQVQKLMSGRIDVECPNCGNQEAFFMTCPFRCPDCGTSLPDVAELHDNLAKRKAWHFTTNGDNNI
jgi:hypothetical protein